MRSEMKNLSYLLAGFVAMTGKSLPQIQDETGLQWGPWITGTHIPTPDSLEKIATFMDRSTHGLLVFSAQELGGLIGQKSQAIDVWGRIANQSKKVRS